jgi:Ca2+-binding EF-hand superfamily protein
MINMFISIILDGYNTSRLEENMRINDSTISIFKEKWMVYDEDGSGLIKRGTFKQLIMDLVLEELRMFG